MKYLKFLLIAVCSLLIVHSAVAQATLKVPSVISDDMVLQQNSLVNIWGYAKPKAKVSVAADWVKAPVAVKADKDGYWIAQVETLGASFNPHKIVITSGKESLTINGVLFGEVWLCSGQSNMEFKVKKTKDLKKDLKKEQNTAIHLYNTGHRYTAEEQNDIEDAKWVECNPKDLGEFSAVAYGFGKELQEELNLPIGLIDASYGGTFVEGWMKNEVLNADPKIVADNNAIKHKTWAGKPSQLYNANIYPIRNITIAGVIWYQGCANVASRPRSYDHSLEVLINSWRAEFRNPEMPFYLVQLVPHTYAGIKGAQLRECQEKVAKKVDHCEFVTTMDQQEIPGDIHPRYKADVAHRLAACALGEHYGKSCTFRAPAYKSFEVQGNEAVVTFNNAEGGLTFKGKRINGFQLGVKDPENAKRIIFTWAEAKINADNTVTVYKEGVTAPCAVRYCFNEDVGNLFSTEGLPVAPFRTDKNNGSQSGRPYVETPSEVAIVFEGTGYTKTTLKQGSHLWPNLKQVLSDYYPKEYEGFDLLVNNSIKNTLTAGGTITAKGDGYVYCVVRSTKDMLKFCYKGWTILTETLLQAETPEGKKIAAQYIARFPVKEGDTVELPKVKDHYSVFVLAKSIEYVEK